MSSVIISSNRVVCRYNGEMVLLESWGKNGIRVRAAMMGEIGEYPNALLPLSEQEIPNIEDDGQRVQMTNGLLTACLTYHPQRVDACRIEFRHADGRVLLQEIDVQCALKRRPRAFSSRIGGGFSLSQRFIGNPGEKIYGMGQYQLDTLDWKGSKLELAHRNSQASVPFYVSNLGYGFLWNNPAIGYASFAENETEWYARSSRQIDYWVTAGTSPAQIMKQYAQATGFVPMMPECGLGFWQCKLRYWNQEQLLAVAKEYKRKKYPLDVIICDFFHWNKLGDFSFDPEFFPDPRAMCRELKEMGIRLMVSVWPAIDPASENYKRFKENNYLIRQEYGVSVAMRFNGAESEVYDATNPEARKYVWDLCKKNYVDQGVSLFWLDEAEPDFTEYDYENYRCWLGTELEIGNLYPLYYTQGFFEGMKNAGMDEEVTLVRCAWAGSQRYGALVWSGDIGSNWESFRRQICAGLNMGMAGIPWWTTDIGGFSGGNVNDPAFHELLIRWFQWGTFCPVMRLHGDRIPAQPVIRANGERLLNSGGDNEVWSYGEKVEQILAKYLHVREVLKDYLRDVMKQAHEEGKPVMRPMFFEYPDQPACWTLKDQYMLGSDLLVAPVLQPDCRQRNVFLPENVCWLDPCTGKRYAGGQIITLNAPLETLPILVKESNADLFAKMQAVLFHRDR